MEKSILNISSPKLGKVQIEKLNKVLYREKEKSNQQIIQFKTSLYSALQKIK